MWIFISTISLFARLFSFSLFTLSWDNHGSGESELEPLNLRDVFPAVINS